MNYQVSYGEFVVLEHKSIAIKWTIADIFIIDVEKVGVLA